MNRPEMVKGRITLEYSKFSHRVRGALKILLFGSATYEGPWLVVTRRVADSADEKVASGDLNGIEVLVN